tara:strand:- start:803 stop:2053 length:1251 start_codon:yes stop_codon:yes gene_type:complete
MPDNFSWGPDGALPSIENHSRRKLDVLRSYLDVYFDTVVTNPRLDCLNITLVDGFSGGGAYQGDGVIEHGSPLVLLNAVEQARKRINRDRKKTLEINARFVFVDDNINHVEALRERLFQAGFGGLIGTDILLINGRFSEELPGILRMIRAKQRVGRSIFLLDQFGYKDVPMSCINSIFTQLDRPEVLLTFAIDSFLNYLQENSASLDLYRQFGINQQFIAEWQANKNDEALGRLITQRALMNNIQSGGGANFFTPFMLWSSTDNRWMMFAHMAQHQAARDKMLGVHWGAQNSFRHIGKGSLFSLGFDTRLLETKDSLFDFAEQDRVKLRQELLEEIPREISKVMADEHLPVEVFLEKVGNRTAATNSDLFDAIKELSIAREIEIRSKNGSPKRTGSQVGKNDLIYLPRQRTLFSLK